jgi:fatty-acyl-CoA synthase
MSSPAHALGSTATPLLKQTIAENLAQTATRFPDRDALIVRSQKYRASYIQLWEAVTQCAKALLAMDVQKGDRVGVWSPNRYEWVVLQYATASIGAILVNVNPAYQAPELEYVLNQAEISHLFHANGFKQSDYQAMIGQVRPQCPGLIWTFSLDDDWEMLMQRGEPVRDGELTVRERTLRCEDVINIQYTSGTTGFPKGASLTHYNLLNNGFFVGESLGYTEQDRVCVPVPFYHCFGMVLGNLACTSHGSCIVVPAESFQARAVLETVQAERCTSLYGVPTMFRAVLEDPEFDRFDVTSLRTGIMAGAPCPIELMREVVTKLHMPEVAIGYGMTETSPISTMSDRKDTLERRVSTVGRVFPHVEISVRGEDDSIVPHGTSGEFCTRGYSVMRGYWNNDEATRASIDKDGWMHSGDLAVMDEEGYVRIVGRLKDMIIRGGENIYPAEIEAVLHQHPDVSEAHVVGVPSKRYGEEVMAYIRLKPGASLGDGELKSYCQPRMSAYKMPKYWRFLEQFPMTVTGKVQKYRLREMAVEELGRGKDIEETA